MHLKILSFLLCSCLASSAAIFSIGQIGDVHAGSEGWGSNEAQKVTFVLAHTNDGTWNFAGLVYAGDNLEQDTNYYLGGSEYDARRWQLADLTNSWQQFKTNGLFVWVTDGNHDLDQHSTYTATGVQSDGTYNGGWGNNDSLQWSNIVPLSFFTNQVGYQTSRVVYPDIQQVVMTYTNAGLKLVFVNYDSSVTGGVDVASTALELAAQTLFVTNALASFPDHQGIVCWHFALTHRSEPNGVIYHRFRDSDMSGAVQYTHHGVNYAPLISGLEKATNTLCVLSGHVRSSIKGHVYYRCPNGHYIDVTQFNTQSGSYTAGGGSEPNTLMNVLTFDTVNKTLTFNTVDPWTGTTLTNMDTRVTGSPISSGIYFFHNWSIPLVGANAPTRRLR